MNLRPAFLRVFSAAVLLSSTTPAFGGTYKLVKIADDKGALKSIGYPSISPDGMVYFTAETAAGEEGVYRSDGSGAPVLVRRADHNPFYNFGIPVANGGHVYARGSRNSSGLIDGIYDLAASGGTPLAPPADLAVHLYSQTADPALNSSGSFAIHGATLSNRHGIYIFGPTGGYTTVASTQPPTSFTDFLDEVALSNAGSVYFIAQTTGVSGNQIFKDTTSIVQTDSNSIFAYIAGLRCNGAGTLIFTGYLKGGGKAGVYRYTGGAPVPYVVPSAGADGFVSAGTGSINSSGKIIFGGNPNNGNSGIFDGPNATTDKVVASGDMLDGRTLSSVTILQNALDDRGAVAFYYDAGDRYGVALAIPDSLSQLPPAPEGTLETGATAKAAVPTAGDIGSRWPAGTTWQSFGDPTIDDSGSVAFLGRILLPKGKTGPRSGIFRQATGEPTVVAAVGDDSPVPGMEFFTFRDPLLASDGGLLFEATLRPEGKPSGTLKALFYQPPAGAAIQFVTQVGAEVAGTGGAKLASWKGMALGAGGNVGLVGKLKPGKTPKVAGGNDDIAAVWSPGGALTAVLTEAQDLAGSKIKSFQLFLGSATSTGEDRGWFGVWPGETGGRIMAAVTLLNRQTLLGTVGAGANTWQALVGSGMAGPGLPDEPSNVTFTTLALPNFAPLAKGVVFRGTLSDRSTGLYRKNLTDLQSLAVALPGDSIAGLADATVATVGDPASSPDGLEVLWSGQIAIPGSRAPKKIAAIQAASINSLRIVASVGAHPAGTEDRATWKSFQQFTVAPSSVGGRAVILGTVAGVSSKVDQALWMADSAGTLHVLLREGQGVGGSTLKSFAALRAVAGQTGVARSLNANGQIALKVTNAAGVESVAVVSAP